MFRRNPAIAAGGVGAAARRTRSGQCLGQSAQSASLVGKVTDESGGAMPGVTVTVKSPQLQVPQMTAVTGIDGDYRVLELPPGTYSIAFELSGFQTQLRTDVHLTVGLAGKVDVVMKIGALSETIQVSGQSPVVDTVNVTGQTTLMQDQLRTIPMGGTMQEMLPLAAGVSMQSKPDVGDSNLAARSAIITYGVVLQPTLDVEGINTVTDHAADTAVYLNSFSLEEVQFKTSGNNADIAFPGVAQVAVLKSGSNTFHGIGSRLGTRTPSGRATTSRRSWPRRGSRNTNPIVDPGFYDDIFDLGGRIIQRQAVVLRRVQQSGRDAGAGRFRRSRPTPTAAGWSPAAARRRRPSHTDLPGYSAKVSYQLNSNDQADRHRRCTRSSTCRSTAAAPPRRCPRRASSASRRAPGRARCRARRARNSCSTRSSATAATT